MRNLVVTSLWLVQYDIHTSAGCSGLDGANTDIYAVELESLLNVKKHNHSPGLPIYSLFCKLHTSHINVYLSKDWTNSWPKADLKTSIISKPLISAISSVRMHGKLRTIFSKQRSTVNFHQEIKGKLTKSTDFSFRYLLNIVNTGTHR